MKKFLLVVLALSATPAFATEVCGTFGSHTVAPKCNPGLACPMWIRLQYDLTTEDGSVLDLETQSATVLGKLGELKGEKGCVRGHFDGESFEVTSAIAN
jgi:hypothetical protein